MQVKPTMIQAGNGPIIRSTHYLKGILKNSTLLFYTDDMGFGDLSIQNPDSKIPTPKMDKLAE